MSADNSALLIQIGRNIRAERSRRDLTQEAVARLAGMAPTQVARIERGETDSGITKYLRLAQAIGIRPADLFFGVEVELQD